MWERLVIAVALVAGCGHAAARTGDTKPTRPFEPKPAYIPGERTTWNVTWLNMKVATITMAVGQPGVVEGRPAITVRYEIATAGLMRHLTNARTEIAAILDADSGMAIKTAGSVSHLYSGHRRRRATSGELPWRRYDRPYYLEQLGTIGAARGAWRGKLGALGYIPVRVRYKRFHLEMTAVRREAIGVPAGVIRCVRIEGVLRDVYRHHPEDFPYVAWISDDSARVPVRVEVRSGWVGTVKAELSSHHDPRTSATASR